MAADPDRPLADDTVIVDADALAANEQEQDWPVDDHYLVRPESEAGGVPVHPTVESAPNVPRRFPPDLAPGPLLAIAGVLGAVLIAALLVAARNDGGRRASVSPSAEQKTPATTGPDLQTPTTSTSPETTPSDQKATTKTEASVVEVPRVVGLTASSAVADLRDAGLVTKIRLVTSSKRPGLVLRQSPTDAGRVEKGATVRLDVSRARPVATKIEVPSVVGDTVADARQQLQGLGLSVLITKVASDQPLGTVLRQSPHAGAEVGEDERVTLTVSAGQQKIDVPDVTGLDEDSAREQLETAGFQVEATDEPTSDPTQDGLVLRQSPAGTTALPKGGVVSIVVARLG